MPTEQQYREAAVKCRLLAQQYLDHAGAVPAHPAAAFIDARMVTGLIDDAFRTIARSFAAASASLFALAQQCDRRADVCRDYRWRLWAWHQASPDAREQMAYPHRPADWVDA